MTSLKHKYNVQKNSASIRGIEWNFTFEQWLNWWGDDINLRGRSKNSLCMARYNDCGDYSPENCYKSTTSDNIKLGQLKNDTSDKNRNRKISQAKMKKIHTPFGIFDSRNEAAKNIGIHITTLYQRMKYHPQEYYGVEQ
jgi:hypothetical protein